MIIGIKMPINISNFEFLLSSKSSLLNIIDLILLLEGFLNNVLKVSFLILSLQNLLYIDSVVIYI